MTASLRLADSLVAPVRTLIRAARRHPVWTAVAILVFLAVVGILAPAPAAADNGPDPKGFGDMFGGPELGAGLKPTLYEAYPATVYYFDDVDLGPGASDVVALTLNGLANVFMFLTTAIVRGAIVLVWSMFDFPGGDALADQVTGSIGTSATELGAWVLPISLAIGGLVAYTQTRGTQGGGFSQIVWVVAGGLLAVSFMQSPQLWVDTLTDVRSVTSSAVMNAGSNAVSVGDQPFAYDDPSYETGANAEKNKMLRNSADAIWRSYVVTPWCLTEFGSNAACERYGRGLLDSDNRDSFIRSSSDGHPGEYNKDGPMYRWIAGKNGAQRLGMALVAFLIAAVFGVLIIVVSFLSLLAFISAILLLFVGVLFVLMWPIPGKPRSWANKWFETLFGLMIQSVVGALTIIATLILTGAAFSLAGSYGWGVAAGLSIMVTIAAFTMRRTITGILGALTPGGGMTGIIGAMVVRRMAIGGGRALTAIGGAVSRSGARGARWAGRGVGQGARSAGQSVKAGWQDYVAAHRTYRSVPPPPPPRPSGPPSGRRGPTGPGRGPRPTTGASPSTPPRHRTGERPRQDAHQGHQGRQRQPVNVQPRTTGGPHLRENPPPRQSPSPSRSSRQGALSGQRRVPPPPPPRERNDR